MSDILDPDRLRETATLWRRAAFHAEHPGRRARFQRLAEHYALLAAEQQARLSEAGRNPAEPMNADPA